MHFGSLRRGTTNARREGWCQAKYREMSMSRSIAQGIEFGYQLGSKSSTYELERRQGAIGSDLVEEHKGVNSNLESR